MSGALRESGELEVGIAISGMVHHTFSLRPATLADVYAAAAAVPIPADLGDNEPARVAYQMAIDDAQVLLQLVALGSVEPVPGVAALVAALDPEDMEVLRAAAGRLKKKLRSSKIGFPPIVVPNTCSSEPVSA